jgi:hypothetical protein
MKIVNQYLNFTKNSNEPLINERNFETNINKFFLTLKILNEAVLNKFISINFEV